MRISKEMESAYLDYAMSVIVSRALPDARDGLKPVHRRILYAMGDMGLKSGGPHKKSARIVGEVLGKYHPHGDAAVYRAMARMAQDFSMRYILVGGQGNFGSVDGDPPAAMRYTEARLSEMAEELLADIGKDTVDFVDNFDGSLKEPTVLPSRLPNLLVNGSSGIAVGMSTNIPPHNLGEICDGLCYIIDNSNRIKDVAVEKLMKYVKGPDFPTGGIIYRRNGDVDVIRHVYATGRGHIVVQAKTHVEEMSRGRHRIVITELPYQVNKSRLVERIAYLVRKGKLEGITDLRDESGRQGMRVVIQLSRTAEPSRALSDLLKHTRMRVVFGVIALALVDGEPRLLPLKRAMQCYLDHRQQVLTRCTRYELKKAESRAHILEGLLVALDELDEVIATIRHSRWPRTAAGNLKRRFKLTDLQAEAILAMPLRKLASTERAKVEEEYEGITKRIKYLRKLLAKPTGILKLIKEELVDLKRKYGDKRRT
ncbi:MAG: DNA topoisomerase (ATP-hydrolyzing), partial [Chloroflexota bacterium]|nr:DNA topoisomerase (ATP-hydrolyzing) [Chloroflexota bacterium]